ncbi:hypothetical protein RF11_08010 [Thelohanellus kitauei]|uniref:Uncharacterized protein n=1 Tax=Thelohanellus kitauei TaxID=669202 RepID=A0A0C2JE43_THEKT|nr:hypothetical protein RF11_08010 [Thelohanellus kitauei]
MININNEIYKIHTKMNEIRILFPIYVKLYETTQYILDNLDKKIWGNLTLATPVLPHDLIALENLHWERLQIIIYFLQQMKNDTKLLNTSLIAHQKRLQDVMDQISNLTCLFKKTMSIIKTFVYDIYGDHMEYNFTN